MFADDLVLLSTSASGLQSHLDRLQHYCDTWGLDVNITKTKAIIFNGTGRLEKVDLQFDGRRVDVVKQYRYLGVVFDNSGSLNPAANNLHSRALKALFKIRQVNASSNPRVALSLFNTLVIPIATYCSEIWAAKHAGLIKDSNLASVCDKLPIEKLLLKFCRYILGTSGKSSNMAIRAELGLFPMLIQIMPRICRYWIRLTRCDPKALVYKALLQSTNDADTNTKSWGACVKHIFTHFHGTHLWNNLGTPSNPKKATTIFENHCKDVYLEHWRREISRPDSKLRTYSKFKHEYKLENYVLHLTRTQRKMFAKTRISNHRLPIELGRYTCPKTAIAERVCTKCSLQNLGDEYHCVLECPYYDPIRTKCLNQLQEFANIEKLKKEQLFTYLMSYDNGDTEILDIIFPVIESIYVSHQEPPVTSTTCRDQDDN